jgi:hypothetical protein
MKHGSKTTSKENDIKQDEKEHKCFVSECVCVCVCVCVKRAQVFFL